MATKETEASDLPRKRSRKKPVGASGNRVRSEKIKKSADQSAVRKQEREERKARRAAKAEAEAKTKPTDKPVKRRRRSRKAQRDLDKASIEANLDVSDDPDDVVDDEADELQGSFDNAISVLEKMPTLFEQENEQIAQYRHMFEKLKKIMRICEKKYHDTHQSKEIYALVKIYDQMREVIADLRALADYTQHVDTIKLDIIDPFTQSNAAALIEYHKSVSKYLQTNMKSADFRLAENKMKSLATEAGMKIQEARNGAYAGVEKMFAPK